MTSPVTVRWETAAGARLPCFRLEVGGRVSWCLSGAGVRRVLAKAGYGLSESAARWLDRHGKTGAVHTLRRLGASRPESPPGRPQDRRSPPA